MDSDFFVATKLAAALLAVFGATALVQAQPSNPGQDRPGINQNQDRVIEMAPVYVTAEQILKQSLGTSVIEASDLDKTPVRNDISDILRTMPGVNLTGNTASGQRGNNRQIDIRGMGPENTLILIDGRPVRSRDSVRYSWRGERDTRGDSNWVPADAIERIEVIRGASAARYGSGAMGGVVNIITKKVTNTFAGWVDAYGSYSQNRDEGDSYRTGFGLSGPIVKDRLSYRIYANYNRTEPDKPGINRVNDVKTWYLRHAAGREGVINKDVNARFVLNLTDDQRLTLDSGWSRQSNLYTGDGQNNVSSDLLESLADRKAETNRMSKTSVALTYDGNWTWGTTRLTASFDHTLNQRYPEGLAGGIEGQIQSTDHFVDSTLKAWRLAGETVIPLTLAIDQTLTVGFEAGKSSLHDPNSRHFNIGGAPQTGLPGRDPDAKSDQTYAAVYLEDNLPIGPVTLVPSLRFDHNSDFGHNISPGLSFIWDMAEHWELKGGVARAFKAPNLYQRDPNYLLYSKGFGCGLDCTGDGGCYLIGNDNLKPETSLNQEIGIEYTRGKFAGSLTFFRNDYRNKVVAGQTKAGQATGTQTAWIYRWENAHKALVQGFEGNITVPVTDTLLVTTNFTYMDKFINKDTKNPLSVIPDYTVNAMLDWTPFPGFDANLTFTQFGRQKARKHIETKADAKKGLSGESVSPYNITSVSAGYTVKEHLQLRAGIYNLFNKRLLRSSDISSARLYNQPGRSFYVTAKYTF